MVRFKGMRHLALKVADVERRVPSLFFRDPDGYVFQVTRFPRFTSLFIAALPILNARRSKRAAPLVTPAS